MKVNELLVGLKEKTKIVIYDENTRQENYMMETVNGSIALDLISEWNVLEWWADKNNCVCFIISDTIDGGPEEDGEEPTE